MKLISPTLLLASSALLAGCAFAPPGHEAHAHAERGMGGMQTMCGMHEGMMGGGQPSAEQHAMMQERMKSMSPEMRERMQQMQQQCGPAAPDAPTHQH